MVDGLALLRQQLDAAYKAFRQDPQFAHFEDLQRAMNDYQKQINAWRDGGKQA